MCALCATHEGPVPLALALSAMFKAALRELLSRRGKQAVAHDRAARVDAVDDVQCFICGPGRETIRGSFMGDMATLAKEHGVPEDAIHSF